MIRQGSREKMSGGILMQYVEHHFRPRTPPVIFAADRSRMTIWDGN
jgi:hypothetical protein